MPTSTVRSVNRPAEVAAAPPVAEELFDRQLAYVILRLTFGVGMLMRGIVRIFFSGVDAFATGMVAQFTETPLPGWFVYAFGVTLPVVELAIGVLLVLGVWTRWVLVVGALIMVALVFGTTLRADWNLVFLQMFYAFLYYLLLARRCDDAYTVNDLFGTRRTAA